MTRLGILVALLLICSSSIAQECFQYYKEHCHPEKSNFHYNVNDKSTSFLFSSGETREIPFILQNGKDYRIQICADPVFEDIIKFEIVGVSENNTIYTNSSNNFALNLEFVNRKTQEVKMILAAPELAEGMSDSIYYQGCIALLIEEMITVKTGF
ncbi:MAG: hypothetical protein JEZ09_00330 [Salinivirgaceae bacterium]|nr:hypothetical protein [Salinivirgaceae bacterium]